MSKSDNLIEAAAALLENAPSQRLNAVTLNKALFYLDLTALRDKGWTITNNTYIALENGPVISKYPKRLINELELRGVGAQSMEWDGSKPISLVSAPQPSGLFDAELFALAAKISAHFAAMTSTQASNYSHRNPGWKLAWEAGKAANAPAPINLRIALQQIVEEDPWVHAPLTRREFDLLDEADELIGEDW